MHPARYFFPAALLCALLAAPSLQAAVVPGLYTAVVPATEPEQAAQDALRAVLVRLTGVRTAAAEPMFAALIASARHYVQVQRPTTGGRTQVLFDAAALDAAVSAAGGHVWDTNRPLLWVALPSPAAAGTTSALPTTDELHAQLDAEAQLRGVPLLFATEPAGPGATLDAAHRAGAAAALVALPSADGQSLQWTLSASGAAGQWTGSAETGLEAAVDALAGAARMLADAPVAQFDCRVAGVADLPSFTDVLAAVSAVPGVQQVDVPEISGDTLTLHVKARGSPATLARALQSERLQALNTSGDALDYHYQRGP